MTAAAWDGVSDFYEDDEPIDAIRAVARREVDAITGRHLSVIDVAELILEQLRGRVDGWKLQKLCYLVQAYHLARTGLPAFREPIEAWTHGPVIDALYQLHRHNSWNIDTVRGDPRIAEKDDTVSRVVDDVIATYGDWTGRQLRKLTHSQAPWLEARADLSPQERSRRRLSVATMRDYFRLQLSLPDDDLEDDFAPSIDAGDGERACDMWGG